MQKVKYLGPSDGVFVAPYGHHRKGQIREYPDNFAKELLATSVKQRFEIVGKGTEDPASESSLEDLTVAKLTAMLEERGVEVPPKARKAELIDLLEKAE